MKDEESSSAKKQGWVVGGILGQSRYKLWILAAILLLAFWSMLTGSVTLNWSESNLNPLSDHSPLFKDLDILPGEKPLMKWKREISAGIRVEDLLTNPLHQWRFIDKPTSPMTNSEPKSMLHP